MRSVSPETATVPPVRIARERCGVEGVFGGVGGVDPAAAGAGSREGEDLGRVPADDRRSVFEELVCEGGAHGQGADGDGVEDPGGSRGDGPRRAASLCSLVGGAEG